MSVFCQECEALRALLRNLQASSEAEVERLR